VRIIVYETTYQPWQDGADEPDSETCELPAMLGRT
jgi:hypothetical protein